ncbi:MAG TPA: aminomethyl-transferring glycine dehydrogenase subunit GcvPA [Phycisphaerales bacterium]|nr:aminomethyl-transferring glycine dehydrogenase subunit GcvPA [Phycisphaerales bacterium]|tara:strand:+ start:1770 stop:3113 length:1344 start_codon:yes stop_codon:yes gene_type:complete
MDYVQITQADRQAMLQKIGAPSVEALYANLPPQYRLERDLCLPAARSELSLQRDLAAMAKLNHTATSQACFLGGGAYDHFIPQVVNNMAAKGEFVTAYTPYQAEASQGALQAFFEFQTQVTRLTDLDVSNASLYDGATAIVEGVLMALNSTGKRRVLVGQTVNPQYRTVIQSYLTDLAAEYVELPATNGVIDTATIEQHIDNDTAAVVIQSPNVFGQIENWTKQFEVAHSQDKTMAIAIFNPIASAMLKRPGSCGADIAAGEGQPLGIPFQYGGPWLGLFAASKKYMRKMPGRLIGQTADKHGRRGFCLTLQTREQHIRGAKATSNICTNQGLLAVRATVYMSAMGPRGMQTVAQQCYHKAHYLADAISKLDGYALAYSGNFFHEFVVNCPVKAGDIIKAGKAQQILPGLCCKKLGIGDEKQLLIAVTEKRTIEELDALVSLLKEGK